MRRRALLLLPLLLSAPLAAQDATPKPKPSAKQDEARKKAIQSFAKVQQENRKALLGYRWNQREQVWVDRQRWVYVPLFSSHLLLRPIRRAA